MGQSKVQVFFISGIPRSGTTLIQREIYRRYQIATVPEPWILPHALTNEKYDSFSLVGSVPARHSFEKYLKNIASEHQYKRIRDQHIAEIYRLAWTKLGEGALLDKTPRNLFFLDEIEHFDFTVGSLVVLRHPLDIVASVYETWGRWFYNFNMMDADLTVGLQKFTSIGVFHSVAKYEDFVSNPQSLFSKLDLQLSIRVGSEDLRQDFVTGQDQNGDPNFGKKYTEVDQGSKFRYALREYSFAEVFLLRRFLKRKEVDSFIQKYYPDAPSAAAYLQYKRAKGAGFGYILSYVISWICVKFQIKAVIHNRYRGYLLR